MLSIPQRAMTEQEKQAHIRVLAEDIHIKLNLLALREPNETFDIAMVWYEFLAARLKDVGREIVSCTNTKNT
jgi:hypothetical protein